MGRFVPVKVGYKEPVVSGTLTVVVVEIKSSIRISLVKDRLKSKGGSRNEKKALSGWGIYMQGIPRRPELWKPSGVIESMKGPISRGEASHQACRPASVYQR